MRQKQYTHWDSEFFDSVFANPSPDPLHDLKEVSNTATVLGSSPLLSIASLKASCSAIVKLSQEGSTYYSSIRDTSSASGASYAYQPPVLTSDDKVSSWFTDHVAGPSQPNRPASPQPHRTSSTAQPSSPKPHRASSTAQPSSPIPHRASSRASDVHSRPPRTSSTVPDTQIPQSSSTPGGQDVRGDNFASAPRGKQPASRVPGSSSAGQTSQDPTGVPPGSLDIGNEPVAKPDTEIKPRRPRQGTTPVTPTAKVPSHKLSLTDQDKEIIRGLKEYEVPANQTKIFIKNVPTTPSIKDEMKSLLLKHVPQIHDIQHFNDMIIAITDKQGSKEFRMEIEGTVLEAATKALIVVVVD